MQHKNLRKKDKQWICRSRNKELFKDCNNGLNVLHFRRHQRRQLTCNGLCFHLQCAVMHVEGGDSNVLVAFFTLENRSHGKCCNENSEPNARTFMKGRRRIKSEECWMTLPSMLHFKKTAPLPSAHCSLLGISWTAFEGNFQCWTVGNCQVNDGVRCTPYPSHLYQLQIYHHWNFIIFGWLGQES